MAKYYTINNYLNDVQKKYMYKRNDSIFVVNNWLAAQYFLRIESIWNRILYYHFAIFICIKLECENFCCYIATKTKNHSTNRTSATMFDRNNHIFRSYLVYMWAYMLILKTPISMIISWMKKKSRRSHEIIYTHWTHYRRKWRSQK